MIEVSRRGFLKAILAAGVAPAVVRAGSLMAMGGMSRRESGVWVPRDQLVVPEEQKLIVVDQKYGYYDMEIFGGKAKVKWFEPDGALRVESFDVRPAWAR